MYLLVPLGPFLVHPSPLVQRGVIGLLGDDRISSDNEPAPDPDSPPQILLSASTIATSSTATTRVRIRPHTSRDSTVATTTTLFTMGTTQSSIALAATSSWTLSTTTAAATPTPTPIVPEAPATSAEEAAQWKVIGIGIITVGLIATAILSVIFFDSWWNFLCDLVCGSRRKNRRNEGEEHLVPDVDTRDWKFKLANEDGHRYPTLSWPMDMTEGEGRRGMMRVPGAPTLPLKHTLFSDPEPVQNTNGEPLTRKPSMC